MPKKPTKLHEVNVNRRTVLKTLGIPLIGSVIPGPLFPFEHFIVKLGKTAADDIAIDLLRPRDLLQIRLSFHNCKFQKRGQQSYVVIDHEKKPAFMIATFPSQHTMEEAYREDDASIDLPAKFIRAGKSRLVFRLPADFPGMPLIPQALLNWKGYTLEVNDRARYNAPFSVGKVKIDSKGFDILKKENALTNKLTQKTTIADNTILHLNSKYKKVEQQLIQNRIAGIGEAPSVAQDLKKKPSKNLKVEPPDALETALELPTRLIISPHQMAGFLHKIEAERIEAPSEPSNNQQITIGGQSKGYITELWHTRMGMRLNNGQVSPYLLPQLRTIRALWSLDYNDRDKPDFPFLSSLDAEQRYFLVHQTSDFNVKGYTPRAVEANMLMLTPLGAYIDLLGNFDYPDRNNTDFKLLKWEHRGTLGRDHYVKVDEAGYLFPFGHKAALVTITERKFDKSKVAVNRQREFLVVMEPEKFYSSRNPDNEFTEFPFLSVTLKTLVTPNLSAQKTIENIKDNLGTPVKNFWAEVGGEKFPFKTEILDREGRRLQLDIPMIFVNEHIGKSEEAAAKIINHYNGEIAHTTISTNGQTVAFADSLVPDDTSFVTREIRFGAENIPKTDLEFHPILTTAQVKVKAIEELTGNSTPVTIKLYNDDNKAGTFAEVVTPTMVDFNGSADKSGGSLSPNASANALSRLQGVVSGKVDELANLDFDPTTFFNDNASLGGVAKLFGVIPIFELVLGSLGQNNSPIKANAATLTNALEGLTTDLDVAKAELEGYREQLETAAENQIAAIQASIDQKVQEITNLGNEIKSKLDENTPKIPGFKIYKTETDVVVEYKWKPDVEDEEKEFFGVLKFKFNGDPADSIEVGTQLSRPFDTSKKASMVISSSIKLFSVAVADMIQVNFDAIGFTSGTGKKTDVRVVLDQNEAIKFMGPLQFINNLQNIIPTDAFGDGPYINLQPNGVKAGFELGIPNVEVGILSLTNMTLGAYVRLPFTGAPLTIGFNFCQRENPFMLTVSCFGGGGFVAMETSVKGFVMLEAAFEFGAAISFNVAVASGGVSVVGGFYFKLEIIEDETSIMLTGYIRMNGELSLLGIITLAMEFYLALTYIMENGKAGNLYGEASVKVKIEILMFSKSVGFTVRRTLKGNEGDPKFAEMIEEPDWLLYCSAFEN